MTDEPTEVFLPARCAVEVVAGLIPGRDPDPEFHRRWVLTADEWQAAKDTHKEGEALAVLAGKAHGYAALLMLSIDRVNWVRTDWVWF